MKRSALLTALSRYQKLLWQGFHILRNHMLRHNQPLLASLKITYRCNLRCQPCPFHTMRSSELTYSQVCSILDQLHQRGNRLLVIEGGEPLLWKDPQTQHTIHHVVAHAKRLFFSVGITTNGTLPLDIPSDILWVSIDGFAATHNRLRGDGIFERVMENVSRSQHPKLYAHITVNRLNCQEVPDLLQYLNGFFRGMTLQFYYPYNYQDDLFLDFAQRSALLQRVIKLKRSGVHVMNSVASLEALKFNSWKCHDHLIDCANPDQSITQGCYLKSRADIDCAKCGFSPHTEISLACRGNFLAVWTGMKVFLLP